jgi:hypothetical protein
MKRWLLIILVYSISSSLSAQIYFKGPEQEYFTQLNEDEKQEDKNLTNLSKSFFKAYHNRIKQAPVYIADSLHFVITTDFDGRFGALLYSDTRSAGNLQGFIDVLQKAKFSQPGTYAFSVVFPKIEERAVPIWLVQEPPRIEYCYQVGPDGNKVFKRSCFAYFVQKKVVMLEAPPAEKRGELDGYVGASVTVNKSGRVLMVEFDSLSYNPAANDFFAERLKSMRFPGGAQHNGLPTAYTFKVKDQFFGNDELLSNRTDSIASIQASIQAYNVKEETFEPLEKIELDTSFQSIKTLFKYQESNYKFDIGATYTDPIMGSLLFILGGRYQGELITGVLTPDYFAHSTDDNYIYPAIFEGCKPQNNTSYASTCSSAKMLQQVQEPFNYSYVLDSWLGSLSKQVFVVNHKGSIEKIQVVAGSYLTPLDLRLMYVISKLPKMMPGERSGKPVATIFTVLGTM